MHRGGWKYRKVLAALDEQGITANIVRVSPKRFELHVNYEIVKAAKNRVTCNRSLQRLLQSKSSIQINPMNFFQQLAEISPKLDLQLRIMSKDGQLTISVLPATNDKIKSLTLTATPAELDAGFLDAIRVPVQLAAQLDTSEYEKELRKQIAESKKDTEKKVEKDTGQKIPKPQDKPKESPAPDPVTAPAPAAQPVQAPAASPAPPPAPPKPPAPPAPPTKS